MLMKEFILFKMYIDLQIIHTYSDDSAHDFLRKGVFYCEICFI